MENKSASSPVVRIHVLYSNCAILSGAWGATYIFLLSFYLPPWRAVRSYRHRLEVRNSSEAMTDRTAAALRGFLQP